MCVWVSLSIYACVCDVCVVIACSYFYLRLNAVSRSYNFSFFPSRSQQTNVRASERTSASKFDFAILTAAFVVVVFISCAFSSLNAVVAVVVVLDFHHLNSTRSCFVIWSAVFVNWFRHFTFQALFLNWISVGIL